MKKSLVVLFVAVLAFSAVLSSALSFSNPINQIGFQNGCYIGFRDLTVFDLHWQEASTNASYPSYLFLRVQGSNSLYGFCLSGCNVTVNTLFVNGVLEFVTDGAGVVDVYVNTLGVPSSVSNAAGVFNQTVAVASLTVNSACTVQLVYSQTNPGGGGGGAEPSPEPSSYPTVEPSGTPSSTNAFKISDVNLGKIMANSTVTAKMHFTYSESSITIQSISFSEPFQSWYVSSDSEGKTFILSSSGNNAADATLTFNIPNIEVQSFSGTVTVQAVDAFGTVHTSNAKITAVADGAFANGFDWFMNLVRTNFVFDVIFVAVVFAVLVLIARFSRRR